MVWLTLVLGAFLFYQYVEQRHKIIFLKIAGVLAAFAIAGLAGLAIYSWWQDRGRLKGIEVVFSGRLIDDKTASAKLIDQSFKETLPTVTAQFPNPKEDTIVLMKTHLYRPWIEKGPWLDYLPKEYEIPFEPDEYLAYKEVQSAGWLKARAAKGKLAEFEVKRAMRWLAGLPELRKKNEDASKRFMFGQFIHSSMGFFSTSEAAEFYAKGLSDTDKNLASQYEDLEKTSRDHFFELVNKSEGVVTALSFDVCNSRKTDLNTYGLSVSGFDRGRSTAHAVRRGESSSSSTELAGDIIVKAGACQSVVWTGDYKFYPEYKVRAVSAAWKEE